MPKQGKEIPRFLTFGGRKYERVGSPPGSKKEYDAWAKFNREVNGNRVRVIQVMPGKYLAYINYPTLKERTKKRGW